MSMQLLALTSVIFPVGSVPTSPSHYRPLALAFNTLPTANVNITVNHINSRPAGETGMPIETDEGFTITNFSDFYWIMDSDIDLQAQTIYDVKAAAEGYEDNYEDSEVADIRFVRRIAGNENNPWVLQGATLGYDNSTNDGPPKSAIVIAKDAEGAISAQGALFAYSQNNANPDVAKTADVNGVDSTITADAITITEGDSIAVAYVGSDVDIDDSAILSLVFAPPGAVTDFPGDNTGSISWKTGLMDAGDTLFIVKAVDENMGETLDTLTITVTNTPPVWVTAPGDTVSVSEDIATDFTYEADTDPENDPITYSQVTSGAIDADSVSIDDVTGVLTVSPALGDLGNEFTVIVTATDVNAGAAADTTVFNVIEFNSPPEFITKMPDTTVSEGATLTMDFGPNVTDAEGDPFTFSHMMDLPDSGATTLAGVYTWTPGCTDAGVHELIMVATDDVGAMGYDTVQVTVVEVNVAPTWLSVLPADTTVFLGEALEWTYIAEDCDADVLTYGFVGNSPGTATIDPATGEFSWTPATASAFPVLIEVYAFDGTDSSVTTTSRVTIEVVSETVSGNVSYNRSAGAIPIAGAVVKLMDGAVMVADTTTDAAGAYSFTDVASGEYTIMTSKTDGWEGSNKASDALVVSHYDLGTDSLNNAPYDPLPDDLSWIAAYVTLGPLGEPSALDAQAILQRYVNDITEYAIADWQFEDTVITVTSSAVVTNIEGICAGDARSDFDPSSALAKTNIAMNSDEVLKIQKAAEFQLPINLVNAAEVGSFSMKLKFPANKMEFVEIKSVGGTLASNVKDGIISIAWADLTGKNALKVEDGGTITMITFKATEAFAKAEEVTLEMLKGGEITDRFAKDLNGSVSIPVITVGIPDVYALSQNYPNPFNPSTTIQYDLPENGKVNLAIYNTLGEQIAKLVDTRQEAGSYELRWNASNLATGVYFYRLHVEGVKGFVLTKKMILMK